MNRRILVALFAACLAAWTGSSALSESRLPSPPEAAALREAEGSIGAAVSEDSLRAMARLLSTCRAADSTRFALRESSIGVIADTLAARLGRYTGSSVERVPFVIRDVKGRFGPDSATYAAANLVCRVAGTGDMPGAFLVTAHYDCISTKTPGWQSGWRTLPSPGADDDGSGVAAVMEAARALRSTRLPFAVTFVLFSGEELGLVGSDSLVGSHVVNGTFLGDRILGVLNSDMLGYHASGTPVSGCILSTYNSSWLSDIVIGSAAATPGVTLRLLDPGPSNYDHAPFWIAGIPAVTFTEPLLESGDIANPYYHTLGDTLGTLDFAQARLLVQALVDFLERLGQAPPEITMSPSDLFVTTSRGVITGRRSFAVGDTIGVRARVRNVGVGDAPSAASVFLTISIQNATGSRVLFSGSVEAPGALEASQVDIPLVLDRPFTGQNRVSASISVSGMADDPANDAAALDFAVEGPNPLVLMHAFEPNPITGSFPQAHFCVNLAQALPLSMEIYNVEGERVATAPAALWGTLHAGLNCLPCSQLFPTESRLASGIYIYRLVSNAPGGRGTATTGRFAVQN